MRSPKNEARRGLYSSFFILHFLLASAQAWTPPLFTRLDSLFITAATGEPRFQAAREAAEKALLADTGTLPYLLEKRLRNQTPRQQHYVERLFTLSSDSGRNARPRALLAAALASVKSDTLRIQLLYVGSQLGDSSFRTAALPWLKSSSEPVRRMAVRNLGTYPRPQNFSLLMDGLFDVHGLELQQRLWSLEAQGQGIGFKRLAPLLNDSLYFNRRKVRDLILKAADTSWSAIDRALGVELLNSSTVTKLSKSENELRLEWLLLAQDAKDGRAFLEARKGRMTDAERIYFGLGK